MVGAIEIGLLESTFDVAANVADRFERLVRRPDSRDPKLRIVRADSRGTGGQGDHARRRSVSRSKKRFDPRRKDRR